MKKETLSIGLGFFVLVLDQIFKHKALHTFPHFPDSTPCIWVLGCTLHMNSALWLGITFGNTYVYTFARFAIAVVCIYFVTIGKKLSLWRTLSLSFIAAGAFSNSLDGFFYSSVVDYIQLSIQFGDIKTVGIFNLGDLGVYLGTLLLVFGSGFRKL